MPEWWEVGSSGVLEKKEKISGVKTVINTEP